VFAAPPTICPRLLTDAAKLEFRQGHPSCLPDHAATAQRPWPEGRLTARVFFSETPTLNPLSLIQRGTLLTESGSTPSSVLAPLLQLNACVTKQSEMQIGQTDRKVVSAVR